MFKTHDVIALTISTITLLLNQRVFSIPEDKIILDDYEQLTIFIISNFNLPSTHKEYILRNLGISENISEDKIR